jgi:hypothetical protein
MRMVETSCTSGPSERTDDDLLSGNDFFKKRLHIAPRSRRSSGERG